MPRVACENFEDCHEWVNARGKGTAQYVAGFVKFGDRGDYNRPIRPRWSQRYLCSRCTADLLHGDGESWEQLSLDVS